MSARAHLAQAQADLVRALGTGAPVPAGFDPGRVEAAARALLDKRRRLVAKTWPSLVTGLGATFATRFDAWARLHPMTVEPRPLVDGRAFVESLRAEGPLPPDVARARLAFDIRWRPAQEGEVRARRGPMLLVRREGAARQILVALRLPGGHIRMWP
ncbi:hypothetical protein LZ198_22625 [Myxococcus sp. K15C18031901]|uniref:hypothetical protein n=1 Tax=Myxococcus dinghuensis TaxID=2906761 RepID=UPI0020A79860|nr:hypothetical protein [Myxococcus dinghuensis]MCP3101677.1 hypothetical protein [Myxococcus dinghuensis]